MRICSDPIYQGYHSPAEQCQHVAHVVHQHVSTLPFTGVNLTLMVLLAILLIAGGLILRSTRSK